MAANPVPPPWRATGCGTGPADRISGPHAAPGGPTRVARARSRGAGTRPRSASPVRGCSRAAPATAASAASASRQKATPYDSAADVRPRSPSAIGPPSRSATVAAAMPRPAAIWFAVALSVLASRIRSCGMSAKASVEYPVRPSDRAAPLTTAMAPISQSGVPAVRKAQQTIDPASATPETTSSGR